jgi:signal transduction histidine kinase/ActR/RegA family two-component response regulator
MITYSLIALAAIGGIYALVRFIQKRARKAERLRLEARLGEAQRLETLGQLTSGIAHDFNNIVSIVLGYSEMARDNTLEGSRTRYNIEEALKAGYRAKDLLQQLLAVSRGSTVERKPIRIVPLITDSLHLVRASVPRTVNIEQELDPETGSVSADLSEIHQLLLNLCLNAGYAMRESGGTLSVKLKRVDLPYSFTQYHDLLPGEHVKLQVSDTGSGIPSGKLTNIFDAFYTTKPEGEGTGLGLAMVQRIINGLGGSITVESEEGKGTIFTVFLPVCEDQPVPEATQTQTLGDGGKPCILFVDDEEDLAKMGKEMLERLGYEVVIKTSSKDALEEFKNQPDRYQVIITDYFMPNMTGTDLAERVKDIRPDVPLILLTGFGSAISPERASEVGFGDYLLKPMASRDLSRAITRALTTDHS